MGALQRSCLQLKEGWAQGGWKNQCKPLEGVSENSVGSAALCHLP